MSVSLALLPVALTLRLVMGKERFDNWVESSLVKYSTDFANDQELVRVVRRAGYDAEKWGETIKTHIDEKKRFFFWELIDGKWTAVFSEGDPEPLVKRFMADINQAAGREVFADVGQRQVKADAVNAPSVFPTNFRDMELLHRTLKEFGSNPVRQDGVIECSVEQTRLVFRQHQDGVPVQVEVHNPPEMRKIFEYLADLDDDYKRCVQSIVYAKLKERVAERNMSVESEEVLEDNSIVLTINIRS